MRLNKRGFSLIELLLVVAIILVIIAISTPMILRSMQQAYDASAVAYLRQLQGAQENYRLVNREYADSFSQLEPYLTSQLAPRGLPLSPFPRVVLAHAGPVPLQVGTPPGQGGGAPQVDQLVRSMYIFGMTRSAGDHWEATAEPVRDRTDNRYYYTDETGVIRFAVGSLADASSPPIPELASTLP